MLRHSDGGLFRSIRRVSSAGREAMVRDVRSLQEDLDKIHPCHCRYGLEHVEAALQAAQGEEEVMLWVQDHYQQYPYRHLLGLVTQTFSSMIDITQKRLKDAVSFLDELYSEVEREDEVAAVRGDVKRKDSEFAHLFGRRMKNAEGGAKKGVRQSLSEMGSGMSSGMSSLVKGMSLKK